nr:C45 family autoproteolytic acyltransferase/hydrolase [Pseudomonadota bacterium]
MQLTFEAVSEARPGPRWRALFHRYWPAYRAWLLRRDGPRPPSPEQARAALRRHMPELLPTYDRLLELAGGDPLAARLLSCWRPPAYLISCSQAALSRPGQRALVRNYDLDPHLNEGLILHSAWTGRQVIAGSEFLWGAADGMNDAGLALSLAFGGRRAVGDGFGIPLILRYLLEVCGDLDEAVEALR